MSTTPLLEQLAQLYPLYTTNVPNVPAGMTGEDVPIYRAWLKRPRPTFSAIFFNVRVGPPSTDLLHDAGSDAQIAAALLSLRIDAIAKHDATWWILEFHRTAAVAQYGRALAYPTLLQRTHAHDERVRTTIIARVVNPFLLPLFTAADIPILIADPNEPEPFLANPESTRGDTI